MSDLSYSKKLRNLSKDYYQHHLGLEDYRAQRKAVLDLIDEEFNGRRTNNNSDKSSDTSLLMKTIAFFKNNDIGD